MKDNGQKLDFATVIASSVHDMKNSLTLLLGSLDDAVREKGIEDSPLQGKLLQAQHEGNRLNRNLIQLLALYRLEQSQLFVNITENKVSDILEEVALESEQLLSSHNIKLEIVCDENLVGFFDRDLISEIINTIINNSYRYTQDTIHLVGESQNGYLSIRVEDNGPGYPEEMLRSGNHTSPIDFHTGNTGLGLYFAAQVAKMHSNGERSGYTQTDNQGINNGGRFSLYLP